MANDFEALKGQISALSTAIDGIRGDIDLIKSKLPADGGLTADQVTELRADLDAVVAKAQELDAENPEPAPPTA